LYLPQKITHFCGEQFFSLVSVVVVVVNGGMMMTMMMMMIVSKETQFHLK
jgi:hypothetical protein